MKLTVLRHPRVLEPHLCYGRLDVAIASLPETRAILAERIDEWRALHFGSDDVRIVTSPRTRCRVVADWLGEHLGRETHVEPLLAEMDLGTFEGAPYTTLEGQPEFQSFMSAWTTATAPGGESLPAFEARIAEALRVSTSRGADEVWIAHAGVVRALRVLVDGATWAEAMRQQVPYLDPVSLSVPSA
ncbi:MAG: histidine phosphatase family protein [Deltaproteobacteria bacterium]|nr:histidine phosphatase family protein [Deltaproteobacteria bacterium]